MWRCRRYGKGKGAVVLGSLVIVVVNRNTVTAIVCGYGIYQAGFKALLVALAGDPCALAE